MAANAEGMNLEGARMPRSLTVAGCYCFLCVVEPPAPRRGACRAWSDREGRIWVSGWSDNTMLRFDPAAEKFEVIPLPRANAAVRQILGRLGEVLLPEGGTEFVTMVRTG